MRETAFIRLNIDKWRNLELLVDDMASATPDEICEAYEEVMSDLSFAQTHYPDSHIAGYLNSLALALHRNIYMHHSGRWRNAVRFWTHEIPLAVYESRKCLLVALLVFVLAYVIGVISTLGDKSFPDFFLGSDYMAVTRQNIAEGKPMGIYGTTPQSTMFLSITVNNVGVALKAFAIGVFTSVFPCMLIIYNGIMVGVFQTFFYQQHLLTDCLMATMLHGTLELSAIILATGSGIVLGNGWLFPGTFSRTRSFLIAARKAVRIIVSTIPVFVFAAFIEGFLTRYTHIGDAFRLLVIAASASFIVFYYVLLPIKRHRE